MSAPLMSIRMSLRHATQAAHARLDQAVTARDIAAPGHYADFLCGQAAALWPAEAALEQADIAGIFPDWAARTRSKALRDDLAQLDRVVTPLPQPRFDGAPDILGAMYVLEGSRLGASVILSRVRQAAPAGVTLPTAFLGHGDGARLWPTFLATLEHHPAARAEPDRVAAAACDVFAMFEASFNAAITSAAAGESR